MIERCECCGVSEMESENEVGWYVMDDNMELMLCEKCAEELEDHCDLERLEVG